MDVKSIIIDCDTGVDDALVMDMGGTTTDTAALVSGRVRLNAAGSNVGGRRTHVQALDLRTVGLGGDSLVLYERNRFTIGPGRVAPSPGSVGIGSAPEPPSTT